MRVWPFPSTFLAGFECSSHRRGDRRRLDLVKATRHDQLCAQDYALAAQHGLRGVRDGFRWHLIEPEPGRYDWDSIRPMLTAARNAGVSVIWDLCHYGYPDWLDLWSEDFPKRFAEFCARAVALIRTESGTAPAICAVNEISFWAWLGGEEGKMNPHAVRRSPELKRQLVRAALAGIRAAREADPETVVISAEPLINIFRDTNNKRDVEAAQAYHVSQYEALDMLLGRRDPDLGGDETAIDIVGLNYYPHNQWRLRGGPVPLGHHDYRPLADLLAEVHERYGKPMFIAETGAEHSARPIWLSYVGQEVRTAMAEGIPVHGICIYPVTDYQGWDNDRICQVGLFCPADENGARPVYAPLADELKRQQTLFASLFSG